jgi:hypothetical protein
MPPIPPIPDTLASLRPVGFWRAFDSLSTGKALLVIWRSLFGTDFRHLQPFLQPTPEHSFTYPCTAVPWCECDHEVSEDMEWEQVGVCTCGDCEPIPLTRQDTIMHSLNRRAFAEAVRDALGFQPAGTNGDEAHSRPLKLGLHPPLHAPVYLYAPTSTPALLAATHALSSDCPGPFLLLTPTPTFLTPETNAVLSRAGCAHAALSTILNPAALAAPRCSAGSGTGLIPPMIPILEAWAAAVASHPGPTILEGLHREIAAVRSDFVELRTARQRLEKMLADGTFAFTRKVDAASFKILCAILAEGDVAKAGRRLGITDSMMRYTLAQWEHRGPAYAAMLDLVRWRKRIGRKETLPLNDNILHENAETTDYPGLLSDVLDGLLSMTANNWQDLCEDLAARLRPVLAASNQNNSAHPTPIRGSP